MNFPTPILNKFFQNQPNQSQKGIISIFGDFGVGKTTFALQTAINSARLAYKVIFIYSKPNLPVKKIRNLLYPIYSSEILKIQENMIIIQSLNFEELSKVVFNLEFLILRDLNKTGNHYNLIELIHLQTFIA